MMKHHKGSIIITSSLAGLRGMPKISGYVASKHAVVGLMKAAALETGAKILWGASWHIDDITKWDGTMQEAMNDYIDIRRKSGRTPFIDGPHFELN